MTQANSPRIAKRARHRAHWWLASLLVGCLLPVSPAQAQNARFVEQLVQIYWLEPVAQEAASQAPSSLQKTPLICCEQTAPAMNYVAPHVESSIQFDTLTRRGPPQAVTIQT